jgi:hypothetical protein
MKCYYIDQLKCDDARSAAPFSNNTWKKNPKRPGRKPGQKILLYRLAPLEEGYTGNSRQRLT